MLTKWFYKRKRKIQMAAFDINMGFSLTRRGWRGTLIGVASPILEIVLWPTHYSDAGSLWFAGKHASGSPFMERVSNPISNPIRRYPISHHRNWRDFLNHIQQYTKKMIHHYKLGLILKMQTIHKSFSVIHHIIKTNDKNHMITSIDAEEAFDEI